MDDPEQTKEGLREAYRRLLELDFELLLLAHGAPVTTAARDALQEFVESSG
jgi:glyoxylase-like metal-dependent hydrolase (beta-lactamase superfamily II)